MSSPRGPIRKSWPSQRDTRRFPSESSRIPSMIPEPKEMMSSIRPEDSSTLLRSPSPELPTINQPSWIHRPLARLIPSLAKTSKSPSLNR